MHAYPNIESDLVTDVNYIHQRTEIIQKLKNKFLSFGYKEVYIPTFQPYDLYVNMNGTVNQQEMMKTIDHNGNVLVLRPDVTIPLTQQVALSQKSVTPDLRYFYILEVFRQAFEAKGSRESTQAGVEYLGNPSPEADAEIIALSIQVLNSIGLTQSKIELGHADFFKQLSLELQLEKQQLQELRKYIQAKNVPEIEFFMKKLQVSEALKEIVTALPFLYGQPQKVFQDVKKLTLTEAMSQAVAKLEAIYQNIEAYGFNHHIVIDLSLINHMDYYSDMIFQGFIEQVGKPVLMGGRYNRLSEVFDAEIPAIGFAFDLQILLERLATKITSPQMVDIRLTYPAAAMKRCMDVAEELRQNNFQVVTYPETRDKKAMPPVNYDIYCDQDWLLVHGGEKYKTAAHLLAYLTKERN